MLQAEASGGEHREYHRRIIGDPQALQNIDFFAVHGYSDGVYATAVEKYAEYWGLHYNIVKDSGKPSWMTETSGYSNTWSGTGPYPGALGAALAIGSALKYGQIGAWVWWQGSSLGGLGEYNLIGDTEAGNLYYVHKHFYKYIRPGAQMVKVNCADDDMLITAFAHKGEKRFTVVIVNGSSDPKKIEFKGGEMGGNFVMYQTTSSDTVNFRITNTGGNGNTVVVPRNSVCTFVNFNY
jgi:O-glycosyl hydrolase